MENNRQLVILAGGKGSRLKGETLDKPKPLVSLFDGRCILGLLLDRYLREFHEIVILAGYKSEQVVSFIAKHYGDDNIRVLCEEKPEGTGGALLLHQDHLASEFVVMNGDTWFENGLQVPSLRLNDCLAGMVLTRVDDGARYGTVEVRETGKVKGFREKKTEQQGGSALINSGTYLFSKRVLEFMETTPCSLEQDLFPALVERELLTSWTVDGRFLDIGIPETFDFSRKNKDFFQE